jgi:hypothetical protein
MSSESTSEGHREVITDGLSLPDADWTIAAAWLSISITDNNLHQGKPNAKTCHCRHPKVVVPSRSPLDYRVVPLVSPLP